ncbi:protein lin-28 homolog isoform X3 [Dermacentor albipictus]|uniref:protein lin-28 homolog isoform X3 n=1 Tax=Dermacentor albipictus TaxID=60249 RepID=UPI0038FBFD29
MRAEEDQTLYKRPYTCSRCPYSNRSSLVYAFCQGSEVIVHTNGCTESSINGSGGGAAVSPPPGGVVGADARRRGKCKWFNVAKGWGFITPYDGGPDVFVHQSVIQMSGFRSLGDDEEVEFECKASDKGVEATAVSGPEGGDCKGSHRRPMSKKRFRKIRCYNCGEFANHIAAKCTMGPQPKRCHQCKSADHLIADCPQREDKRAKGGAVESATTTPHPSTNGDSSLPEEPIDNAAAGADEAAENNNNNNNGDAAPLAKHAEA